MGDRRNVLIEYENGLSVVLYTHWGGSELGETLARALVRGRSRWDDTTYLTRIVSCEMVKGSENELTGFGIEPVQTGSACYVESSPGYDFVVNPQARTVAGDDKRTGQGRSFEAFIKEMLPT